MPPTPKRLMFQTPGSNKRARCGPSNIVVGRTTTKRRRAILMTGKRGKRKSVKEIVQDITQEKKRYEQLISQTVKHVMGTFLLGEQLITGTSSSTRIGSHIRVTGLNIKGGIYYNTVSNSSNAQPVYLNIWVVQTKRETNPEGYWWQSLNQDSNLNYSGGTGPLADAAGDFVRLRLRMNRQDIKLLARRKYMVCPPRLSDPNACSVANVNFFVKMNQIMHFNTAAGAVPPYDASQVRPNIWVCWALSQPNPIGSVVDSNAAFTAIATMYFKE